ncbi:MAG TPA: response regulator [Desulfopila sp.]|nr:response regulator [Desulfopila sp.]
MSHRPAVLVADDEKVCLLVASKLLQHLGLRAIHAHDGIEAVNIYQQYREEIVCVLLDINMPNMNGIEVFNRLKEIDDDVSVIIVSGYVTKANMKLLEPNNPLGYIEKPLDVVRLKGHLKKIIAM